jgi:hypothetical protein
MLAMGPPSDVGDRGVNETDPKKERADALSPSPFGIDQSKGTPR